jgi:hypothetical protein
VLLLDEISRLCSHPLGCSSIGKEFVYGSGHLCWISGFYQASRLAVVDHARHATHRSGDDRCTDRHRFQHCDRQALDLGRIYEEICARGEAQCVGTLTQESQRFLNSVFLRESPKLSEGSWVLLDTDGNDDCLRIGRSQDFRHLDQLGVAFAGTNVADVNYERLTGIKPEFRFDVSRAVARGEGDTVWYHDGARASVSLYRLGYGI